jgi:hypothetical protein
METKFNIKLKIKKEVLMQMNYKEDVLEITRKIKTVVLDLRDQDEIF